MGATMERAHTKNLFTSGDIAHHYGVAIDKVHWILRSRDIPSIGRLGNYRIFDKVGRDEIGRCLLDGMVSARVARRISKRLKESEKESSQATS